MPKEDFTEREIRKIRQLLMYLLKLRDENRTAEMREKLDEVASENEFPEFGELLSSTSENFDTIMRGIKQNATVAELYFQLMEIEADTATDEEQQREYYRKALQLGMYSEELDKTFSLERKSRMDRMKERLNFS